MRWSILISHTQDQEVQDARIDYLRVLIDEAWPASELISIYLSGRFVLNRERSAECTKSRGPFSHKLGSLPSDIYPLPIVRQGLPGCLWETGFEFWSVHLLRRLERYLIPKRLTCKPASTQAECHRIRNRAGFKAFQTADALSAADIFRDAGNINRAFRFTTIAMRAAISIDDHSQGGNLIEHNEQCAHWAKIFAPESFIKHRGDDKY